MNEQSMKDVINNEFKRGFFGKVSIQHKLQILQLVEQNQKIFLDVYRCLPNFNVCFKNEKTMINQHIDQVLDNFLNGRNPFQLLNVRGVVLTKRQRANLFWKLFISRKSNSQFFNSKHKFIWTMEPHSIGY